MNKRYDAYQTYCEQSGALHCRVLDMVTDQDVTAPDGRLLQWASMMDAREHARELNGRKDGRYAEQG